MHKFPITIIFIITAAVIFLLTPAFAEVSAPSADPDRIQDDVYFLASDELEGRFTGSSGCEAAADYIRAEFESMGLLPGDTSDGDYFQEFDLTSSVNPGDNNAFVINTLDGVYEGTFDEDFQPLFLSTDGEVSGDVVFAGYGITAPEYDWDDYDGLDVDGKIVFALKDEPGRDDPESVFNGQYMTKYSGMFLKARNAAEHGASAIILAPGPAFENDEFDLGFLGYSDLLGTSESTIPMVQVTGEYSDILFSTVGAPLSMYHGEMERHNMAFGCEIENVTVNLTVDLVREHITTWNVAGILPGSDENLSDEYVIIGAHYDHIGYGFYANQEPVPEHIHNGADDNASGVGGILEIARTMVENDAAPRRSILFLTFSAEEEGLLGSKAYVADPLVPLDKTCAMLNFDMIGRVHPDDEGNDFVDIHGLGSAEEWYDIVPECSPDGEVEMHFIDLNVGGSDFLSFYKADIPVLNFFSGIHDDYNTPADDADKINFDGIADICETAYGIILDVANRDEPLTFHDLDIPQTAGTSDPGATMTYVVYLGTIPDFSNSDGGGYWIAGASLGSPAEEAGVLPGDCMIKLGDYNVTDIYTYTLALGNFEPGDTVEMVVLRDGEEVVLVVTFDQREG